MAVGVEQVVELGRKILSETPEGREAGAENASDWSRLFSPDEAGTIVRLLAVASAVEVDARVREAQLHAILEVSGSVAVGADALWPLRLLAAGALDAEQSGYLDALLIR
ncbi:hypothetical protein ACFV4N_12395 [Actinosynnema sp. NPDC059797]